MRALRNWVAVAISAAVIVAVIVAITRLWSGIGDSEISPAGWVAMALGIILTLGLGIGLMTLVFISSRRGYDEIGGKDH
jgi:ABC-type multidrug transport system permease subunit